MTRPLPETHPTGGDTAKVRPVRCTGVDRRPETGPTALRFINTPGGMENEASRLVRERNLPHDMAAQFNNPQDTNLNVACSPKQWPTCLSLSLRQDNVTVKRVLLKLGALDERPRLRAPHPKVGFNWTLARNVLSRSGARASRSTLSGPPCIHKMCWLTAACARSRGSRSGSTWTAAVDTPL